MFLSILTPSNKLFSGSVNKIEIPTLTGVIGIFPGHIPLATLIIPGILKFVPLYHEERIIDETQFLFENDATLLNVDEGAVFVQGDNIQVFIRQGVDLSTADNRENVFDKAHLEFKNLQNQ